MDQETRKRPAPSGTVSYGRQAGRKPRSLADKIWVRLQILKAYSRNVWFSALFSQGTALFQQLLCISNAFFRQTLVQSCIIECEILQSPMVSYQSQLFIATAINDYPYSSYVVRICLLQTINLWCSYNGYLNFAVLCIHRF